MCDDVATHLPYKSLPVLLSGSCALLFSCTFVHVCVFRTVYAFQGGSVRLCAGVYLGGDGREILIDPLIAGLRRGEAARELQRTWDKILVESNKAKQEREGGKKDYR